MPVITATRENGYSQKRLLNLIAFPKRLSDGLNEQMTKTSTRLCQNGYRLYQKRLQAMSKTATAIKSKLKKKSLDVLVMSRK